MSSKREQVIQAAVDLISSALPPQAKTKRNAVKQETIPPDGYVIINDGDPGEPETTLNPTTYVYTHRISIEIAALKVGLNEAETRLDDMLSAIGTAVAADRTLGGLCDYLMVEAPTTEAIEAPGAVPARVAEVGLVAVYGTADPLN